MSVFESPGEYMLFHKHQLVERGELEKVVLRARALIREVPEENVLVFDGKTGRTVDLDRRLTDEELLISLQVGKPAKEQVDPAVEPSVVRGRGRPKLGVVAREVTLLPRHWEWLASQPGGVSVTLRKLVEEARRKYAERDRKRNAQEACYRFLNTMAGDWPGFEEAIRALFAGDRTKFESETATWTADVRDTALQLAAPSFENAD